MNTHFSIRIITTVFACALCSSIYAQEVSNDSMVFANENSCNTESIQSAVDACLLLVKSVESNNITALIEAKEAMQACKLTDFSSLKRKNQNDNESLNGHLVFNVAFVDSLIEGKNPYMNADEINKSMIHRGQMRPGEISTKTCFIKAKGNSVYTFTSHGRQELAVIAEPGGLITTRVHVTNKEKRINEWHNDIVDVAKGQNSRKAAFTLPCNSKSLVTLEIINCTGKDISVVVISN